MEITEVRVKLTEARKNRLQAFCSITIDNDFVVRDLKVIEGQKGIFVAMPSRKLTDRCQKCSAKNYIRASYCNECGAKLDEKRALKNQDDSAGKVKLYADTAHPINSKCREYIQQRVLAAFKDELKKSNQPGYKPPKMMDDVDYEEEYLEKDQEQRFGEGILP
ncbi:MAG: septation protein SpoVG family protein [Candidatus Brocadiales bacterium]